jgi:hypothetical protein
MGWERKQRGGLYYFKSVRIGGQPRKLYLGKGQTAEKQAQEDNQRRQQRQALLAEQAQLASADAVLQQARTLGKILVAALLVLAGRYHHHGEWRRRRIHESREE